MTEPSEEEKDRIRKAADEAIDRVYDRKPLPGDGDAIDAYFRAPWSREDFRPLTEEERERLRRRVKPGQLPWLDKTRKQP
jgi:hypothetical protein